MGDHSDHVGWLAAERMALRVLDLYAQQIGPLTELMRDLGVAGDAEALLTGRTELPAAQLKQLYGRALSRLSLSVSAAEGRPPLRPADWRVVLYGMDGGRTLREAILRTCDCLEAIDGRCGLMVLRVVGDCAQLRFNTLRRHRDAINCLVDLNGIPQVHSQLSWLIGKPIPVIDFALDYPRAAYDALELPPLPLPVQLDVGWSGFTFPATYLDFPLIRGAADRDGPSAPAGLLFVGGQDASHEPMVASRVRAFALQALRDEQRLPSFAEIAGNFGCSAATLRRHLAREGSSYREIRNSCRREIGLDLLHRSDLPIEEIAARLDFCDSDAFRGAFREWIGETPTRYRQLIRNGALAGLGTV